MERYIEKSGKKLRYGYTTGTCATAGAKAAAEMLFSQTIVEEVKVQTPKGWILDIPVEKPKFTDNKAICSVIKDAGDDPDVTHGLEIVVSVEKTGNSGVEIVGGKGVGLVTQKGLAIEPGFHAINPVPRMMITGAIEEILEEYGEVGGIKVIVSVPKGEEIAKKTFNPRLGIVGGLSIIGTTGIVEPMSEEALKESIALELSVLKEKGHDEIVFVPGNYGLDFASNLELPVDLMVKTSNFIGFMLEKAAYYGIKKILFVGHLGKMVKVAGGIFNTHSRNAGARMEILSAWAAYYGGSQDLIQQLMHCHTTDEALEYLLQPGAPQIMDVLAEKVKEHCENKVFGEIEIEAIIFSKVHGRLGESQGAKHLTEDFILNAL
jgi:cobalt-precorrin-5B (C1)-methyltransferase